MKFQKGTAAIFLALTLVACGRANRGGAAGVADPPFEGNPPEEAYLFEGEPGAHGGTMVLATPSDMKTFNVILASESSSADILWIHVFRCLVDYNNAEERFDPGLCTRWESSPDAKEWTFQIRRGVCWSDGHPFTADDVIFTYNVVLDESVDTAIRDVFVEGEDENGKPIYPEIEKLNDHAVRFRLHKPNVGFLDAIYNLWLIPRHKWESAWREGRFNQVMSISDNPADVVGLGPFRIKEYVSGQRVVLERNPHFWKVDRKGQRLPYLDRIVFIIAKDFNTILSKFQAGEIDILTPRVRAEDYALVKRMAGSGIKVEDLGISFNLHWMTLNQNTSKDPKTGKPFLELWKQKLYRDQRFRQAISYAIDREGLAKTVFAGRAVPVYSFVTPGDKRWYYGGIMKYPYDPGRARQMLEGIGLRDKDGDGFLEDDQGYTVEINIMTNAENSQRVQMAAFIAENLKRVGIKSSVVPMAFNLVAQAMQSSYNFDAIVLGWVTGVPPGLINNKNVLLSSGQQHACFPRQQRPSTSWEAQIDELVQKMEGTIDEDERRRIYGQIQRIWSEQLPEIDLVAELEAIAYKDIFGNMKPAALPPRATWNCEEIYIKRR
jgi:peptide/nickel transport system substrate-binding protein